MTDDLSLVPIPQRKKIPLLQGAIVKRAMRDSVVKLNPASMAKNPVMLVVEVGSLVTTVLFFRDLIGGSANLLFEGQITVWLWFTVLFANFAEAVAEGRGKAQADTLRRNRQETMAQRELADKTYETIAATSLAKGDIVMVKAGEVIPSDGDVVEGVATVDESAITGESAPVIRESGGDRSAVTGGTRVLSDWLRIRITVHQGETFIDRMIALVEGAERQKTPNEIALNILLAGLTIIFLFAVVTLLPYSMYAVRAGGSGKPTDLFSLISLLVCLIPTTIGALLSAIGIAVAIPIALGLGRYIQSQLYGLQALDPVTITVCVLLLAAVLLVSGGCTAITTKLRPAMLTGRAAPRAP